MKFKIPHTLSDINALIHQTIKGDENMLVSGINEIHKVVSGDLTFVDHPKYYDKALNTAAQFILINKDVEVPENKAIIISDDPFRDYVFLCKHFVRSYPKILSKARQQKGRATRYQRRKRKDSRLNPSKSLKDSFSLLRVADNHHYPAFFSIKKNRYMLQINKITNEDVK